MEEGNTEVVSVKVSRSTKKKMHSIKIPWSELLRDTIEAKIKEHERRQNLAGFLEFRSKTGIPKNRSSYTSEVLVRKTREER